MSSIIFGYTVSLSTAATPSTGFLVAYDTDGILKQKDEFGVITPIGGGPTAGVSSTFSLAQVLAVSNDSESYSIIMGTSTHIKSSRGGGQLQLDYSSDEVLLSTDNGAFSSTQLYLTNGYTELSDYSVNSEMLINAYKVNITNGIASSRTGNYIQLNSSVPGGKLYLGVGDIDVIKISATQGILNITEDNDKFGTIISSRNSYFDETVRNSVILGGRNITAGLSDSVYITDTYIQDSKRLRGELGDASLRFSEYNDLIIENNSSLLAVLSSSSSVTLTKNGVLIFDTDATVNSPSIDSSPVFISTKNSVIDAGVKNAVIIGGENLTNSMTNSVVLGEYVNINNQYTLPNFDGLNGYVMTTDGSGNVTWQPQNTLTTPSLSQVLAVDDFTDIYSIEMGTATSIYSINGGGQINLDFGTSSSVLISTDNGALSTAYIQLDNSDIVIDSTGELSIGANTASVVITNGQGLVYGFDYSATFVTYSLIDKNYVDSNYLPVTGGSLTGDLTINGNLVILGTQTVINTENLYVEDNIITLNVTYSGPAIVNSGIEVNLGDGTYSKILWDAGTLYWQAGLSGSESTIITENGSGLLKSNNTLSVDFATVSSVSYVDAGTTSLWNYITSATPSLSDVLLVGNTTNGTDIVTSNDDVIIAATGGGVLNLRFKSNGSVVVGVPAETYGGKGGSGNGGGVLYLDPSAITLGLNGGDYSKPYVYLTTSYSQFADYSTHSSVYYGFNLYRNSSFNNYSNGVSIKENVTFNFTSSNQNNYAIIIGSRNSTINAGVYNSVVIGGQGLTATESNTVYLGSTVSINNAYKLPNVDGLNGQVLTTNGSGIASWISPSSGVTKYSGTASFTAGVTQSISHSLNTEDVIVQTYDSSGIQIIPGSIQVTGTSSVDIMISSSLSSVKIVIIG